MQTNLFEEFQSALISKYHNKWSRCPATMKPCKNTIFSAASVKLVAFGTAQKMKFSI